MKFTAQQETAYDKIGEWLRHGTEPIFTLAGFAGTGKTTLINAITETLPSSAYFCAFTGKAALAMRDKGIANATTIHSLIYKLVKPTEKLAMLDQLKMEITAGAQGQDLANIKESIEALERDLSKPEFILNMDAESYGAPLLVVDEYSMLTKRLVDDLCKFGKKILFVGDPGQLDPVEDKENEGGGGCPLNPDFFLTDVVRQALDSPILRAATAVREHGYLKGITNTPEFAFSSKRAQKEQLAVADQVLCGTNATRKAINAMFATGLNVGDKVVCLKNNHQKAIFNGMIAEVSKLRYKGEPIISVRVRDQEIDELSIWGGIFHGEKMTYYIREAFDLFDHGYAITCHKAQGSEWDKVLIVNDWRASDRKWLYTAITRARKACRVYNGR